MDYKTNQDKDNFPPSFKHEPTRKQIRVHRCNPLITRSKWTNEALEEAMDIIENGTTLLRKASKHYNIPLTSLLEYLYGKTKSWKHGRIGMRTIEEDQVVVAWILSMQEVGLSINLQ